jgi:DNA-binding NtrC family response regulator
MGPTSDAARNPLSRLQSRDRISVLTVLCDRREQSDLLQVLSHSNWEIHNANSFEQSLALLRTSTVGVVVAQYRPAGGLSWWNLLEETRCLTPSPRLIVTDRQADKSMWAEVLNLGAHDLLMQPFVPEEVFRVIACAWHSWKTEWNRCRAGAGVKMTRSHAA